ncbi:Gfo/Idh/MocA family protein [Rhizobium sp. BR 314]|uniref:Gfo/Idh/MocA family protein n=1 Tax=Rhizobium sp. BR 314 TaxID=3040013 RepID=UPI0039BF99A4
MTAIKVGLVGPGTIGRVHRDAIAATDGVELTAVAGGTAEELAAFGTPANVQFFADASTMIDNADLDVVVIATPSGSHYAPARAALDKGLHVVVEKPLAVDLEEAIDLYHRSLAADLVCSTMSQRRLEAQHQDIHRRLHAGELGRPIAIEGQVYWHRADAYYDEKPWRKLDAQGGGSLFNQGIHTLDLMLWLFGPVASVTAEATNMAGRAGGSEDFCQALLLFENGARGTLITSTATPPGRPAALMLFTDQGHVALNHTDVVDWSFPDQPLPATADSSIKSGAGSQVSIGIRGHVDQWEDVRDAIFDKRPARITFRDGLEAVRVITAIYRSAETGRRVAMNEIGGA